VSAHILLFISVKVKYIMCIKEGNSDDKQNRLEDLNERQRKK